MDKSCERCLLFRPGRWGLAGTCERSDLPPSRERRGGALVAWWNNRCGEAGRYFTEKRTPPAGDEAQAPDDKVLLRKDGYLVPRETRRPTLGEALGSPVYLGIENAVGADWGVESWTPGRTPHAEIDEGDGAPR